MAVQRLTDKEVVRFVKPHWDRLWRIATLPFYQYLDKYPNQTIHRPRTRANIVNDLMCNQARVEFSSIRTARIIEHASGNTLLGLSGRLLIRFKKLDEDKKTRNIKTKFVQEYDADAELPGLPGRAHRLTLGYRLQPLETHLRDVLLTSRFRGRLEYDIELYVPDRKVTCITDATSIHDGHEEDRLVRVIVRKQPALGIGG